MKYNRFDHSSTLGSFINDLRKKKKMTLKDLGDISGVSYSQISKIEKGIHKPSIPTIEKLSEALSVNSNELLKYIGIFKNVSNINNTPLNLNIRFNTLVKFQRTCQLCGSKAPETSIIVTYIYPIELGGGETEDNAITLCVKCFASRQKLISKHGIKNDFIFNEYKDIN